MQGYRFTEYIAERDQRSAFEKMVDLFMEMLTYTAGDVDEAIDWLREVDQTHGITNEDYTVDDFIKDLYEKGYIKASTSGAERDYDMGAKGEQLIRRRSLDQIFGQLKKGTKGDHRTGHQGQGDELTADRRQFEFGDRPDRIAFTDSIRNAQIDHGIDDLKLTERNLEVMETEDQSLSSTVLMIDISHSMILYGEDRITPAKKVAMALAELIRTKYPKDTLDIVVFGDDAWEVRVRDLPYLTVGPYHTNTVAGLERAMDILRRKKHANKQIFMITDGKPTCIKEGNEYFVNSWGMDPRIVKRTMDLGRQCRKAGIPVTTFMIAKDPYLQQFVEQFTEANNGKAFYTSLKGLGEFIFEDYERNRRRNVR